jgi:hypothetical protein
MGGELQQSLEGPEYEVEAMLVLVPWKVRMVDVFDVYRIIKF